MPLWHLSCYHQLLVKADSLGDVRGWMADFSKNLERTYEWKFVGMLSYICSTISSIFLQYIFLLPMTLYRAMRTASMESIQWQRITAKTNSSPIHIQGNRKHIGWWKQRRCLRWRGVSVFFLKYMLCCHCDQSFILIVLLLRVNLMDTEMFQVHQFINSPIK